MRFLIKLILIGLGIYFCLPYTPWWVVAAIAFTINLIVKTKGSGSFFSGFLGVSISWFIASYSYFLGGVQEFYNKIAELFYLPSNGLLLIIAISFLMGLIGGLTGYSGNALRNIFKNPNKPTRKSRYPRPDYSNYSR